MRVSGRVPAGVRPTADNVRESIFNILENRLDFTGKKILDLCAGTGAMGFEALSRGAESTVFIEKNKNTAAFIKKAAVLLKIPEEKYKIITSDALAALKKIDENSFDIAFFDPPYESDIYNPVIKIMHQRRILKEGGIFSIESSLKFGLILPEEWEQLIEKKYGEKKISFFKI